MSDEYNSNHVEENSYSEEIPHSISSNHDDQTPPNPEIQTIFPSTGSKMDEHERQSLMGQLFENGDQEVLSGQNRHGHQRKNNCNNLPGNQC